MALNDFFPFRDGQPITAANMNELVYLIRNGLIYDATAGNVVGDLVHGLEDRVTVLESKVQVLDDIHKTISLREQHTLIANQQTVTLQHVPELDTEMLFLNGMALRRSYVTPENVDADYSLSGNLITFAFNLYTQIEAGDTLAIVYRYEV